MNHGDVYNNIMKQLLDIGVRGKIVVNFRAVSRVIPSEPRCGDTCRPTQTPILRALNPGGLGMAELSEWRGMGALRCCETFVLCSGKVGPGQRRGRGGHVELEITKRARNMAKILRLRSAQDKVVAILEKTMVGNLYDLEDVTTKLKEINR